MKAKLKLLVRRVGLGLVARFGARMVDQRTGECLGRVLFVPWKGRLLVIGLGGPVQAQFLPQTRLTFWRTELGFSQHPKPDFPSELPRP